MRSIRSHLSLIFAIAFATLAAASANAESNRAVRPLANDSPAEARRALELGRHLHASLILREHFATLTDTVPELLLLAARAEAGWDNWDRVVQLLGGRAWLDTLDGGLGWDLLGRARLEREQWVESGRAFAAFLALPAATDPLARGRAELLRASAHTRAEQYPDAFAAYDAARAALPSIEGWIALRAAESAAAAGDLATVELWLGRADKELAESRGWRYRVEALRNAEDANGALAAAESAAKTLASSSGRASAWVTVGQLRLEQGDAAGARTALRTAIETSPGTSAGVDGARLLSEIDGLDADEKLLIGQTYLRHGNLSRAISGLQSYINAGAGTAAQRERLRWDLGIAQFNAGRYDDAEKTLLGLASRQAETSPSRAADALFYAARSQYRDGRTTLARRTFLEVAQKFPRENGAARALYIAADLEQDDGNIERATERFRATIATGTDVEEVGLAFMRLGGIAYQTGDYRAARDEFDGYRRRYPNGRRYVQAAYWSALASTRIGDETAARERLEEVRRLDPFSYYGVRAADLLGKNFWDLPLQPEPATTPAEREAVAAAMNTIDLLRELGWDDAASTEIDRVRRTFLAGTGTAYAFAEALNDRGLATTGIGIGWELFRRGGGWNTRLLRIIYPFPYRDILLEEARESGVDPFLAAGLIRQESMFNPNAVSSAGAIGLMQVLPATGRTLAARLGARTFDPDMLKHAEFNAHLGMSYLDDQLARFDGRLPVVLAAYNAGPHRITRWQEFPEFADDELFAERIPFAETRDYVKIVQNNARIYEALYGPLVNGSTPPQ